MFHRNSNQPRQKEENKTYLNITSKVLVKRIACEFRIDRFACSITFVVCMQQWIYFRETSVPMLNDERWAIRKIRKNINDNHNSIRAHQIIWCVFNSKILLFAFSVPRLPLCRFYLIASSIIHFEWLLFAWKSIIMTALRHLNFSINSHFNLILNNRKW